MTQAVVDSVRARLEPPISLRDLGSVRLKDLSVPEDVYQLVHPKLRQEFPALRSPFRSIAKQFVTALDFIHRSCG